MKCVSTENQSTEIDFDEAIFHSLPSLKGLWVPKNIEKLPPQFFENLPDMSFTALCKKVMAHLLEDNSVLLEKTIDETYNFVPEIHSIGSSEHFLETYWGPTFTFKDFGARFMATYLQNKLHEKYKNHKTKPCFTILVSTSGDTGSAIASAFLGKSYFKVVVLYPNNKISDMQELQITTYGENVIAFAIDSDFDNCQNYVKKILIDPILKKNISFISANSINIARLLPQCLYYFYAYSRVKIPSKNIAFVVPCGNCGNLVGGLIAQKLGLPIDFFIAAQNDNNALERYVNTGQYSANKTIHTISNAMDVGDPSNLKRIRHFFKDTPELLRETIKVMSVSQQETENTIKNIYDKHDYVIDPHTAVAYAAYKKLRLTHTNIDYVFVATAHPAKFGEKINELLQIKYSIPQLEQLRTIPREKFILKNNFNAFKLLLKKKNTNRAIVLIGMPGCGKTTLAKKIHELYKISYIDIDDKIETGYGMTLFQLLDKFGEDGLSLIEEQAILTIKKDDAHVISTGGSVIYSKPGMIWLQHEIVIYLKTDFDILKERTQNFTNRGIIFNGKTPRELYDERVLLYEKNSDLTIDCSTHTIEHLAKMIVTHFIPEQFVDITMV